MKDKSWITFLAIGPMLLIPVMVVLISFIVIGAERTKLDNSVSRMEQDMIETLKSTIHSKVNNIVDLAVYRNSVIKEELHDRIQQRVNDAYLIASKLHSRYSSVKPEQEVKALIVEALRPLVWNEGESFIWILDFDGVFKLAPGYLRHLEGQSIIDFKDATGREVIKEEIKISSTQGQGFLWDTFTKPSSGSDEQFEQLAFVKNMDFYNWYMGSGEFLDTATKASDHRLLAEIGKLGSGGSDYFFIVDTRGVLLLNYARPELVGNNFQNSDNSKFNQLFDKVMHAVNKPGGDFIEYEWFNPKVGESELKLTYVKGIPGSDWIIGSGFHPADISREMAPKIAESSKLNQIELTRLQIAAFWSFLGSIIIAMLLSYAVYRLLWSYRKKVVDKHKELTDLNDQLEVKVLDRTKALAVENDELEQLARTDSLTGIGNRFSFMKIIEGEMQRANRFNDVFSLIILDIDYFKTVNDRYGHDVGDIVLIELTQLLQKELREVDSFCRFGGEEFVILLPETDLRASAELAERLRRTVENHSFDVVGNVTISLGVGEFKPDTPVKTLIKMADIALYKAKHAGRNQICFAD